MRIKQDSGWNDQPIIAETADQIIIETAGGHQVRVQERGAGIEVQWISGVIAAVPLQGDKVLLVDIGRHQYKYTLEEAAARVIAFLAVDGVCYVIMHSPVDAKYHNSMVFEYTPGGTCECIGDSDAGVPADVPEAVKRALWGDDAQYVTENLR